MWRKQEEPKPSSPQRILEVQSTSEQTRAPATPAREPQLAETHLGPGITVQGEITSREDVFIDGEVRGNIRLEGCKLTIGPKGRVTADLDAREIVVHGWVKGRLRGGERVKITRTGQVTGETVTPRIEIEDGAVYHGRVETVDVGQAGCLAAVTPDTEVLQGVLPQNKPFQIGA